MSVHVAPGVIKLEVIEELDIDTQNALPGESLYGEYHPNPPVFRPLGESESGRMDINHDSVIGGELFNLV